MSYKKRNTTHIKRNITSKKSKKEKTNIIPFKTKKESPPKPLIEILIKKQENIIQTISYMIQTKIFDHKNIKCSRSTLKRC